MRTAQPDDVRTVYAVHQETFEDHWEPHPSEFETWWERQRARTNYDPSLWFLIRDGDEVAAIARNELRGGGGYVGSLGVRPPWKTFPRCTTHAWCSRKQCACTHQSGLSLARHSRTMRSPDTTFRLDR